MTTILLAFLLLAFVIMAMSVGVLLGRKPIKGSCGGVGAALGEKNYNCDICGDDPNKCEDQQARAQVNDNLVVDIMKRDKK
ncbi:MAG: (Na+)-NQR maturation NqrM [Cellvibrionaceae bacterium]